MRADSDQDYQDALGSLGVMLAVNGDREGALEMSRRLGQLDPGTFPLLILRGEPSRRRAYIALHLGDRQRAVELLERAFAEGLHFDADYHVEFQSLWGYPPFEELMRPKG